MNAPSLEHAAYMAAHKLNEADLTNRDLATKGARQTYKIDRMAEIIMDAVETYYLRTDAASELLEMPKGDAA